MAPGEEGLLLCDSWQGLRTYGSAGDDTDSSTDALSDATANAAAHSSTHSAGDTADGSAWAGRSIQLRRR
jgi:hypothetical protein